MLAGRAPFPDGAGEEKLACHRNVEPQSIEQLRPDLPTGFGAVLRKMMAKRPDDRYPTPAVLANALTPFIAPTGAAPTGVLPAVWSGPLASTVSAAQGGRLVGRPANCQPGGRLPRPSLLGPAA